MCVCGWGGGDGEREGGERERGSERGREGGEREGGGREGERGGGGRKRGRTSGLSQSVRFFFPPLILFHVMGLVLRRRNGTEKNTLL